MQALHISGRIQGGARSADRSLTGDRRPGRSGHLPIVGGSGLWLQAGQMSPDLGVVVVSAMRLWMLS